MPMITPAQIRAARLLANLSQADLASATGLPIPTIKQAESEGDLSVSAQAIAAIRSALEAADVKFIDPNGSGPGVRLRKA